VVYELVMPVAARVRLPTRALAPTLRMPAAAQALQPSQSRLPLPRSQQLRFRRRVLVAYDLASR
jgi:hypothetical protein